MIRRLLLPQGAHASALPLLQGRAMRAFADGYVAVLLPAYLLALGLGIWEVGLLATTTLLGSALATLAIVPISSKACIVGNDGVSAFGEAVKESGLAYIGASDQGQYGFQINLSVGC